MNPSKKWSSMPANSSKSISKEKNRNDSFKLELKPMPEIALIDPITGKLPKNYKEILVQKESKLQNGNDHSTKKNKKKNDEFGLTLKPMPEIELLDPFTLTLPKNYKEILAQKAGKSSESRDGNTRRSKDLQFHSSKLRHDETILSKTGYTQYDNRKIGPRKALFKAPEATAKVSPKNTLSHKSARTQNTEINESVLLDIEETEKQLFLQKGKMKTAVASFSNLRATPVAEKNTKRKRSSSSATSLEEFQKLEVELKTPSTSMKRKKKNVDLLECIQKIMVKFNENRDMMEKITMNTNEINNNILKILDYIRGNNIMENFMNITINNNSNNDRIENAKENISPTSALAQPSVQNALRVTAIKNNFTKKVLFDLEASENSDSPARKNIQPILKNSLMQTPNTVFQSVSRKAQEQLLKLQDTPKSTIM